MHAPSALPFHLTIRTSALTAKARKICWTLRCVSTRRSSAKKIQPARRAHRDSVSRDDATGSRGKMGLERFSSSNFLPPCDRPVRSPEPFRASKKPQSSAHLCPIWGATSHAACSDAGRDLLLRKIESITVEASVAKDRSDAGGLISCSALFSIAPQDSRSRGRYRKVSVDILRDT